jgi:arginine decarboxylase
LDNGELEAAMGQGREFVSSTFIIPYPPGFPILVPGQVISNEILAYMKALDVTEIHGYNPELGLSVFTHAALASLEDKNLRLIANKTPVLSAVDNTKTTSEQQNMR